MHEHVLDGRDIGRALLDAAQSDESASNKDEHALLDNAGVCPTGAHVELAATRRLVALLNGGVAHLVLGRVGRAIALGDQLQRGHIHLCLSSPGRRHCLLQHAPRHIHQQLLPQQDESLDVGKMQRGSTQIKSRQNHHTAHHLHV